MKRFIFSQIILLLCALGVFPQLEQTLAEQMTRAVARKLPEWKQKNPDAPFDFIRGIYSPGIESNWISGNRTASLKIYLTKSRREMDDHFASFLVRGVIPPNRKIENLGDRAHLVETASRVEIEIAKANVYAILNVEFPDARREKNIPYYYAPAPREEVERALELARAIAGAIDGERVFSPCSNDFFRPQFPAPTTPEEELSIAVQRGDAQTVKSLIARNANLNHKFTEGNTLLHAAVRQGCLETVKTLISAKADVDAKNEKGVTALMLAANFGDLEMVKYLISAAAADVSAKDASGRNAAFFVISSEQGVRPGARPASTEEKAALIKYLVGQGLKIDDREAIEGDTLLIRLLRDCYGSPECKTLVDLFLDLGADASAENKSGETALINSVRRINVTVRNDFVRLLLARGARAAAKDKKNLSALDYALQDQKLYNNEPSLSKHINETIDLLKDAGAIQ